MQTLEDVEQVVAEQGLTHQTMLDFFRLIATNHGADLLQTFEYWVGQLREAGVAVDENWYERIASDYALHGRLTYETLIESDPAPDITLGADDPNVL